MEWLLWVGVGTALGAWLKPTQKIIRVKSDSDEGQRFQNELKEEMNTVVTRLTQLEQNTGTVELWSDYIECMSMHRFRRWVNVAQSRRQTESRSHSEEN